MVMTFMVAVLLLADPVPTEVEACGRALYEQGGSKSERRARAGRCAEAFKQPGCAKAILEASKRQDARWPVEPRRVCCEAYLEGFAVRRFLERPLLCDDNLPIDDRAAATRAWSDFTTSALMADWRMGTADAMILAERFAERFVPDPLELPEDVRAPRIQVTIVLMRISAGAPLIAGIDDPRTPVRQAVKLEASGAEDWDALVKAVQGVGPKLRVVFAAGLGASSKADVQRAQAALLKAGIPATVE